MARTKRTPCKVVEPTHAGSPLSSIADALAAVGLSKGPPGNGEVCQAEAIIGKRSCAGRKQYLVQWAGVGPEKEISWEPLANVQHLTLFIHAYEAKAKRDRKAALLLRKRKAVEDTEAEDEEESSDEDQPSISNTTPPKRSRPSKIVAAATEVPTFLVQSTPLAVEVTTQKSQTASSKPTASKRSHSKKRGPGTATLAIEPTKTASAHGSGVASTANLAPGRRQPSRTTASQPKKLTPRTVPETPATPSTKTVVAPLGAKSLPVGPSTSGEGVVITNPRRGPGRPKSNGARLAVEAGPSSVVAIDKKTRGRGRPKGSVKRLAVPVKPGASSGKVGIGSLRPVSRVRTRRWVKNAIVEGAKSADAKEEAAVAPAGIFSKGNSQKAIRDKKKVTFPDQVDKATPVNAHVDVDLNNDTYPAGEGPQPAVEAPAVAVTRRMTATPPRRQPIESGSVAELESFKEKVVTIVGISKGIPMGTLLIVFHFRDAEQNWIKAYKLDVVLKVLPAFLATYLLKDTLDALKGLAHVTAQPAAIAEAPVEVATADISAEDAVAVAVHDAEIPNA
ncbi:hypothetical protein BV898_04633 [Hypsibius exemplaris]|uniref:Chromo domain-containing protein n=1 Tax=Hypsibius exemplaris TaxID=2072580 RepID=A0A1W0X1R7_HYPEX|nr:hypothetical protein BV898_04633 [Hypsibius exemplaris]